ncbi:MAG TPA: prepilin-type N-terminal cleavage/methylation domain-containing protein [Gemmatimonadaceae bacterium]|nr:prepilin-type N-terminal cleavage/methylation domain-containing protein [Gemmatimonadaceae bacterium]
MRPAASSRPRRALRPGWTLIEITVVLVILAVVVALAVPRLNFQKYRTDAAVQGLRAVFQQAQRTALLRQYDVIVAIDTVHNTVLWYEDANSDGVVQSTEHKREYPLTDGVTFAVPPVGIDSTVHTSVVGSQLGTLDGLPSVTFHRDGAATSDLELYIAGPANPTVTYRAVRLVQGTGRTDYYRFNTDARVWELGGLK